MTLPSARTGMWCAGLIVTLLAGCAGDQEALQGESGEAPLGHESPQEVLAQVEDDFLRAEGRRVVFEVRAEGAFTASLDGQLVLGTGNELALDASGVFGEDSVSLWLDASEDSMAWGNAENSFEDARPDELRDAVVIGFIRMGILHNLARLTSAAPPDRMDGNVRSWVQVGDPRWVDGDARAGEAGISFELRVDGERAGDATLWLDSAAALVGRDQLVQFPTGEMRVSERYRWENEAQPDQ